MHLLGTTQYLLAWQRAATWDYNCKGLLLLLLAAERREKRQERRDKNRGKREERREEREEVPREAARGPQMRPQEVPKKGPRGLWAGGMAQKRVGP